MRFRSSSARPPYLSSKSQIRMLRMIGMLVLVLIAIKIASRPQTWWWMFPKETARQKTEQTEKAPSKEDIDFRVRLEKDRLRPGEFIARRVLTDAEKNAFLEKEKAATDATLIDPVLYAAVKDNTLGVKSFERDAYYTTLTRARDLASAKGRDVAYTVLMINPNEFRGKLITIEGEATRLWKLPVSPNDFGIEELFEVWVMTSDSGNRPYRVVCTTLPEDVPLVEKAERPIQVRVTGYFFKREGYQSEGGLTVAPLLLAGNLQWFPPRSVQKADDKWAPYLVGSVIMIGLLLCVVVWRVTTGDKTFERDHVKRLTEAPRENIDALEGIPTIEPDEMFRQLAEQVEEAEQNAGTGSDSDA